MSSREASTGDVLLALDTATAVVSVAVGTPEAVAGVSIPSERRHAEVLLPAIEELMSEAGLTPRDLTAIATGVGPGLFTGLRVGLTTAKAVAHALAIPVVELSTLDAVARSVPAGRAVAVIDARRGEVFWATFSDGERTSSDHVGPPEQLASTLAAPVVLAGDGATRYATELTRPGVTISDVTHPEPGELVALARRSIAAGALVDAVRVQARYVRRTDAEIAWDRHRSGPPPTFDTSSADTAEASNTGKT